MLKKIILKNFKGIGDPGIEIELKPITLLFGPNSGGKSTILHSVLYAKEIFERKNYNPVSSYFGGSNTDLGGFYNVVHNHDLSKSIELGFDLNLERETFQIEPGSVTGSVRAYLPLEDDFDFNNYEKYEEPISQILMNSLSARLLLTVQWISQLNTSIGFNYVLYLDDELFLSIGISRMTESLVFYNLSDINFQHKALLNVFDLDDLLNFEQILENYKQTSNLELLEYAQPFPSNFEKFSFSDSLKDSLRTNGVIGDKCYRFLVLLGEVLKSLHKTLLSDLNNFRYIGPIRKIPERNFIPHLSDEKNRWADGSAAWDSIYLGYPSLKLINEWLDKLNIGYSLEEYLFYEIPLKDYLFNKSEFNINVVIKDKCNGLLSQLSESSVNFEEHLYKIILGQPEILSLSMKNNVFKEISSQLKFYIQDLLENIQNELSELYESSINDNTIPIHKRICFIDKEKGTALLPHDIGVGLSQILPIIVGVLKKDYSILSIEQPELHVHPAIQIELADLFIDQINKSKDNIFLIETHSEHLMLRFLKRIKQTAKAEVEKSLMLNHNSVSVYFSDNGSLFQKVNIDERGRFTTPWPYGFFEERINEVR